MKTISTLLISGSIPAVLLLVSCKKDHIDKPKETFPITYQFINEGDSNVRSAVFYTFTFFTNYTISNGDTSSLANWYDHVFQDVKPHDTVSLSPDELGYKDCRTYLKVVVSFKKPVYSKVRADRGVYLGDATTLGMTWSRIYKGDTSQIRSAADATVVFKWPSDTLSKYKEYYMF